MPTYIILSACCTCDHRAHELCSACSNAPALIDLTELLDADVIAELQAMAQPE